MTAPTPRSAAPAPVRRIEEVAEAMADLGEVSTMPVADALAQLQEAHRRLLVALNPDAVQPSLPRLDRAR
ncbi:hypothetical protein [Arachnia propionica]|uniref:Uncharacterized protein n=1 Tax=Arachnia propionica TaxID=1750 RepID=A0A3P1WU31_9ACTN|nr:hypothetical protein [Arachnia propionica]RRD49277.1 hypothetical protein EII35_08900 [Arachnia propionica]